MATFAHGGVELYYEVQGRGAPLLLVAGLAADNAFWIPVVATLARERQVIVLDNRGSGRTTPLDAGSSIRTMADDTMALIRHLQLPRVDIVGHSMGGMIAQECAVHYPELVGNLVLVATGAVNSARNNDLFESWVKLFATADRATWFRNLFYWVLSPRFFDNRAGVDALVALAAGYRWQQSTLALANQVEAIAAYDSTATLSTIRARTLVMAGGLDLLFPAAESERFARAIPDATLVTVPQSAHSIPNEFPQEFMRALGTFLAASPPR